MKRSEKGRSGASLCSPFLHLAILRCVSSTTRSIQIYLRSTQSIISALLCREWNSKLGHRAEAAARHDPAIQLLVNGLSKDVPAIAQSILRRQRVVSANPGGTASGYVRDGEFFVEARKNDDGSLIQPTPHARRSIETMLKRQGYDAPFRADALARFDQAADNTRVELAPGLEVVKWQVTGIELALDGPLMDPLVPIKTAYEFLACHLGTGICEKAPPLDEIRRVLNGGEMDLSQLSVERLHAPQSRSFHGIIFEGNHPHAQVQVRFFGKLAFRVHFRRLAVGGPRGQYTHDLATNEESITQVDDDDQQEPNNTVDADAHKSGARGSP